MATEKSIVEVEVKQTGARKTKDELEGVADAADDLGKKTKNLGSKVIDARSKFRAMRGSTAQLGMQLQDVAVQAQMGTSALVILGQQGSQVASLFGPGGALIGAAIAVGAAVANMAFGIGSAKDEISELDDEIDALTGSVNALTAAQKANLQVLVATRIQKQKDVIADLQQEMKDAAGAARQLEAGVNPFAGLFTLTANEALALQSALDTANQRLEELERASQGYTVTVRELENEIVKEINTFGQSAKVLAIRKAVSEGLTGVDLYRIAVLYDLRKALEDEAEAEKKTKKEEEERVEGLENTISALEMKARVAGMTARAEALYRAELQGATQAEKDRINAAFDTLDYERERAAAMANNQRAVAAYAREFERNQQAETDARQRKVDAAYASVQAILRMNDTEQEAFERGLQERRDQLESDYKQRLISEGAYQAAKTELEEAAANNRAEIEKRIAAERTQRLLEFEDVLLAGKSDSAKEGFRIAVNLLNEEKRKNAEKIISDSYAAAMGAYKSLSDTPIIGPALGAAAAATIIAAGVSYAGKSLAGRALGGQVRAGESYIVGERGPEVLTMGNANGRISTNQSITNNGGSLVYSPTVNISGGATEQDRAIFTAQLRQQKAEIADLLARRRF